MGSQWQFGSYPSLPLTEARHRRYSSHWLQSIVVRKRPVPPSLLLIPLTFWEVRRICARMANTSWLSNDRTSGTDGSRNESIDCSEMLVWIGSE